MWAGYPGGKLHVPRFDIQKFVKLWTIHLVTRNGLRGKAVTKREIRFAPDPKNLVFLRLKSWHAVCSKRGHD
jgi:hypothetical protein